MIIGYERLKEFLRRSEGINIDKSDMKRLTDLIGSKLNDLLVIVCATPVTTTGISSWNQTCP